MNEDKVLEALAQLNATMQQGFFEMSGRFEDIERRLGKQEKTAKRTAQRQRPQASEIEKLKAIVQDLARQAPVRHYGDASAIRRDEAYHGFKRCGIDKVTAMKQLCVRGQALEAVPGDKLAGDAVERKLIALVAVVVIKSPCGNGWAWESIAFFALQRKPQ